MLDEDIPINYPDEYWLGYNTAGRGYEDASTWQEALDRAHDDGLDAAERAYWIGYADRLAG